MRTTRLLRVIGLVFVLLAGLMAAGATPSSAESSAEPLGEAIAVGGGSGHSCALLTGGRVSCWGANNLGQLGNGTFEDSLTAVPVLAVGGIGELTGVRQLRVMFGHTCAVLSNGELVCWGWNARGILGDGSGENQPTPVEVQLVGADGRPARAQAVAGGFLHTCALLADGGVNCWGGGFAGRLGDGTTEDRSTPVLVKGIGGEGALTRAVQIGAGLRHTCVVLSNGRVNCWGSNSEGQLGDGTNIDSPVPVAVRSIDGNSELRNIKQLALGGEQTCVLLDNRRVNCWGSSLFAGIGDGTTEARSLPVAVKGVDGNGALTGVKELSVGLANTCALLTTGRVACWGDNRRGGLGDGTTENALVPVAVKSANGRAEYRAITTVAAGGFHTCAVMGNRQVDCWGSNSAGQLGDGTLTDSLLPVTVMTAP